MSASEAPNGGDNTLINSESFNQITSLDAFNIYCNNLIYDINNNNNNDDNDNNNNDNNNNDNNGNDDDNELQLKDKVDILKEACTGVYQFKDKCWYNCLFVYHHPATSNPLVRLVGDFNGWSDKTHPMQPCAQGYCTNIELQEGRYEYKFKVDDNYVSDSHNDNRTDHYHNSIIYVNVDPANDCGIKQCYPLQLEYIRPNCPFFYFIEEWPPLPSYIKQWGIQDRPVYVYLPPSYSTDTDKHYPVIYAHDGRSLFSTGEDGWFIDYLLDANWASDKLPHFILVAIINGDDVISGTRSKEYCAELFSEANNHPFIRCITEIIKPFIDAKYRTLSDRANTFTMGASLGGLLAMTLALKLPEVFSGAICQSPALWFYDKENRSLFHEVDLIIGQQPKVKIYLDSGRGENDNCYVTKCMAERLAAAGWEPEKDYKYVLDYSEGVPCEGGFTAHHHHLWRNRLTNALRFLLTN